MLTESGREDFATNIKLAGKEISDIGDALNSSLNEQGKENRNFFGMLSERRQATTMDNMTHNLITALGDNAKPEDMNKIIVDAAAELGYKVEIIVSDPKNTPSLEGKNGEAHFDSKTGKMTVIINAEAPQNATTQGYMATAMEDLSHVIAAKDGKRDLDIASTTDEKGSESLGRETADYFKDSYQDDSTSIDIKSDGKNYSTVNFGENVGNKAISYNDYVELSSIIKTKPEKDPQKILDYFNENYGALTGAQAEVVVKELTDNVGDTIEKALEKMDVLNNEDQDYLYQIYSRLLKPSGMVFYKSDGSGDAVTNVDEFQSSFDKFFRIYNGAIEKKQKANIGGEGFNTSLTILSFVPNPYISYPASIVSLLPSNEDKMLSTTTEKVKYIVGLVIASNVDEYRTGMRTYAKSYFKWRDNKSESNKINLVRNAQNVIKLSSFILNGVK